MTYYESLLSQTLQIDLLSEYLSHEKLTTCKTGSQKETRILKEIERLVENVQSIERMPPKQRHSEMRMMTMELDSVINN